MNDAYHSAARSRRRATAILFAAAMVLASCGSDADEASTNATEAATDSTDVAADDTAADDTGDGSGSTGSVDIGLFFDGALSEEVTTGPCTLSDGAESTCYTITVTGYPADSETGPFCPTSITDGEEAGGIWLDGENVYDVTGEFITELAEIYGDDNWLMYDEDGNVFVTETAEEFELAARPDVDPSLQNHCVEGMLEWLENGEPIPTTVTIPIEPVLADAPTNVTRVGVSLDGVVLDGPAPVADILAAYTIAAFDDCGGHYNPFDGYHRHAAVGCSELDTELPDGESPMIGYALDGFPVHSAAEGDHGDDLDECGGHETEELGYHYHVNAAEENNILTCVVGQTVSTGDAEGGRPAGPPPGDAPEE